MRRIDIVLALLFVILILGLIFLPDIIDNWRDGDEPVETPAVEAPPEPAVTETEPAREPLDPAQERERVSGILMLHEACADRYDDYAARAEPVLEAWKRQYADVIEQAPERDFHIVIGDPEGVEGEAARKADDEQLALCERNLEAMRSDLEAAQTE